ncbi:MAG: polysaccharide biosynthesis tyrosine autokinase [Alteripontixanthobacter sp.]
MSGDVIAAPPPTDLREDAGRPRSARATPLQQLWAVLYRQRWVIALSLLGALLLGFAITAYLPEKFVATSSVQLEQQTPQVIDAPGLDPEPEDANRFLQTQLDRVRSRQIAMQVARSARVEQSPAILAAIGIDTDGPVRLDETIIPALQERVSADLGLNTRLAQISFISRDAEVSALLANAYAEALIASNLAGKIDTSQRAQEYLTEQLAEAKQKLEDSERNALAYARNAGLTGAAAPGAENAISEPAQQLGQLTNSLAAATARRIDAQQQWQQMQSVSPMVIPDVQQNRAIQELMAQKAQFQAALAEDLERHTEEYPTVAATRSQIAGLDREIRQTAANIKESFRQSYQSALRQERQLESTIAGLRNRALNESERGIEYNTLERDVEINRVSYDGLLQRLREISAASGAPSTNVTLVDRAEPPVNPVSPSLLWNLALASLCGLTIGMGIALLRETMFNTVRTAADIENATGLPLLGAVPAATGGSVGKALADRRSAQSEAYHSIAASLQKAGAEGLPKTLLLTSSQANEGKSTSTLGLARGLVTLGHRVLVINGDLRNPSPGPGFAEALAGKVHPFKAIRKRGEKGFWMMDSGDAGGDPVGLLARNRVAKVLDAVSPKVDVVLIDGPPILGLADAPLLADNVEAVAIVIQSGRNDAAKIDAALARLPAARVIGALLTQVDARSAASEYGNRDLYDYGSDHRIRA